MKCGLSIQRRFQPRTEIIERFFRLVFRKALLTQDLYATDRLTTDPTDNQFLAAALEGQADYVVSRDPHLLNLKHFGESVLFHVGQSSGGVVKPLKPQVPY